MMILNYKDTSCKNDEDGVSKWHNWNLYFLSLRVSGQRDKQLSWHTLHDLGGFKRYIVN